MKGTAMQMHPKGAAKKPNEEAEKKLNTLTVRVSEPLRAKVSVFATQRGLSDSGVVRWALLNLFAKEQP